MLTMAKAYMVFAAFAGMTSVILGAFGAHGLKDKIAESSLAVFQTGVQYQMAHALVLLFVGYLLRGSSHMGLLVAGAFFIGGIVLFSGSLYVLALGGPRWLGPITPLGGMCFIFAWLALLVVLLKSY